MIKNHPVLALIPARGGSKGIPRKNLTPIGGRPLVAWTLKAALGSQCIDQVWLSSDDVEILEVGRALGAHTLLRPYAFANDTASAMVVVEHFLGSLPDEVAKLDPFIVYLQPTSPLRTAAHLDTAFAQMEAQGAHTLISVVAVETSPFKTFKVGRDGRLQSLFDEQLSNARRQDLPKTFIPNGAIYIFQRSEFLAHQGFPSNGSLPFIMTAEDSIDLDSPDDLNRLTHILENSRG